MTPVKGESAELVEDILVLLNSRQEFVGDFEIVDSWGLQFELHIFIEFFLCEFEFFPC